MNSSRPNSRRSFFAGGLAVLGGLGTWQWLRTSREDSGIPWPLRRVLEGNENLWRRYFSSERLATTRASALAAMPRENGLIGLFGNEPTQSWKLQVLDAANARRAEFTLEDIRSLPRIEMTTELCCIEGWSQVVHWSGVRFSSLVAQVGLEAPYVSFQTPDNEYYVGLDFASAMHPQTLLCYEMNDQPLAPQHGAPLRLVAAVKYGIKNIKRIGTIRFMNARPADYWAERGYDWYAGL